MLDIRDYLLEYKRKIPNLILIWTVFLVFIITFILIINKSFKITNYYLVKGIVKDNKLNLVVSLDRKDSIIKNNYIYIDENKYKYKVESISDIVQENNNFYQQIILDIDVKDANLIENNVIESKFIVSKKTILEYIYNLIKGGF
ncbi:MAG: hypothetical protein IJO43_02345 [Bacilli bacterium]|nr:hypothetical protein [Bacilli bacterium]